MCVARGELWSVVEMSWQHAAEGRGFVMAPANTGSDKSSRNAVTRIDQTKSGILCSVMPGARMLKIVVMKLMAPRIDDAPAACSALRH